ncbi:MAG: MerR family transcriptional regulator [Tannerella sp.]|jgi:DNA-binding transcriptional MerR regulator|nr:MerR family transcriptional regulator [Tannerella sp.]
MENPKQYYSIREAVLRCRVNESTLRYWEKEFDEIAPRRNKKGTRFYSEEDLRVIELIYQLVKVEGMTLEGARKALANKNAVTDQAAILSRLKHVRAELESLIGALDDYGRNGATTVNVCPDSSLVHVREKNRPK